MFPPGRDVFIGFLYEVTAAEGVLDSVGYFGLRVIWENAG